jgi:putative endonuclease
MASLEGWTARGGATYCVYDTAMGAFVYMLRCSDKSLYVGSATGDDLSKRVAQHQTGTFPGYTALRRPVELVWSEHFDRITDAIGVERQIKGWSRAKKEALMRGDWPRLQGFAKRRGGKAKP